MLARIAPLSVCQVMPTPMNTPRMMVKFIITPMICSFIRALSLARASSLRVQARNEPLPMTFSWSRTSTARFGSRIRTIRAPDRAGSGAWSRVRVSRDRISMGRLMLA